MNQEEIGDQVDPLLDSGKVKNFLNLPAKDIYSPVKIEG